MRIKLKEIADIHMGFSFRSRLEPVLNGTVAVIQMKDLSDENTVETKNALRIEMPSLNKRHLVKAGDLLYRSRGHNTEAAIIQADPGQAIVASPLMRIRIFDTSKVWPAYLNWFISQPEAQSFFASRAKGSVQRMISKQGLEDLEVVVPSLQKQKQICELAELSATESKLSKELLRVKRKLISAELMRYAKGEKI
ncbi:MAG: restriction endonuclease subunit S [Candidatus Sabulitectum sp.]|nr:restriction endonuclease subunit S [Candidatus Sabulitectum sp.]